VQTEYISPREYEEIKGTPVRTVRDHCKRGTIRASKEGRQWRIPKTELYRSGTDAWRQFDRRDITEAVEGYLERAWSQAVTGHRSEALWRYHYGAYERELVNAIIQSNSRLIDLKVDFNEAIVRKALDSACERLTVIEQIRREKVRSQFVANVGAEG